MAIENVIIIGSGPAGYTAALYSARANLNPLVIEGYQSGGLLMLTSDVENFPGFPQGIQGPELMGQIRKQAERFGARFIAKNVTRVDFSSRPLKVFIENEEWQSQSVIISTGASHKHLGLASEDRLMGKGVSTCATCDGAFFRNCTLVVVGGGDSAMEEANFLTRFATKVYLVHRSDSFRASKIMFDRVKANPKIEIVTNAAVQDILGAEAVEGVRLVDTKNQSSRDLKCEGVFVAIGHSPNTSIFKGQVALDEKGYLVLPHRPTTRTNVPGVFGAGDVADTIYRQAITAAGSGCQSAIDAERYLESLH